MKKVILTTSIAALALAFQTSAAEQESCKSAAQTAAKGMTTTSETATVTTALEAALKAKPTCACEIVTAVIGATDAGGKDKQALIEAIVETAITAAPEQTATILQCASAKAPARATAIEKVLLKVFAGQDQENLSEGTAEDADSEEDSAKQAEGEEGSAKQAEGEGEGDDKGEDDKDEKKKEDDDDYGKHHKPLPILPAPVYLIAPSGGIVAPGRLFPPPSPPVTPVNPSPQG